MRALLLHLSPLAPTPPLLTLSWRLSKAGLAPLDRRTLSVIPPCDLGKRFPLRAGPGATTLSPLRLERLAPT